MISARDAALGVHTVVERVVVLTLLFMLIVTVSWGTWELVAGIGSRLGGRLAGGPPAPLEDLDAFFRRFQLLHEVFGAFLLILIGLELMKTIAIYLHDHQFHVEVVFSVAMIAVARHTIDLNLRETAPLTLIGMGALVLCLALGHFVYRRSVGATRKTSPEA